MKTKTWHGLRGEYYIEVWKDFGDECRDIAKRSDTDPLPISLLNEFDESAEITIHFEANGSFDSGCMYLRNGDPGYPPEGDEERLYVSATIREHGSKEEVRLPDDVGRKLFDMYEQQIQDVELDYSEDSNE